MKPTQTLNLGDGFKGVVAFFDPFRLFQPPHITTGGAGGTVARIAYNSAGLVWMIQAGNNRTERSAIVGCLVSHTREFPSAKTDKRHVKGLVMEYLIVRIQGRFIVIANIRSGLARYDKDAINIKTAWEIVTHL